mgnify:CR=1 FL=1
MKIEDGVYKIELSRKELVALCRGLEELKTLREQYPDAKNGYDVNTAETVDGLHSELALYGSIHS